MEVVPPAPPIDAEMAEDAEAMMASQAAGGAIDSMEYDEEAEAPRYDEAGDVEINDAQQEHDDARSTEMGEEDARDYATLAHAAALQQEFAASSASSSMAPTYSGALVEVEAAMLPAPSSDGMQASQVVADEQLETEAGYEPVEADAPEQSAQIVEVQDEADAQPGQAGDTAQGDAATEPSAVDNNHAAAEQVDQASTSALAAASTSIEQHDEAQAEPAEASAEDHATSNEAEQPKDEASAAEQPATGSEVNHDHVVESNTAASHPTDAPQVKEGNDDDNGTAAHNVGASTSSPSSPNTTTTTQPVPLRLTFEEESFVLFPSSSESSQYLAYPSDGTDGPIESVDAIPLSVPTEVYWEPLEALFKGLRVKEALGEFLEGGAGAGKEGLNVAGSVGSDLVLRLPDLGLVVREDSVYTREVRLVDLVRLHEGLGAQSSLHIEVSEDDSFLHELRGLQEHVKENVNAGALGQESHDDEEGVETGETTLDGQVEEVAAADAQHDAQEEEAGVDAAEQTFVTVAEGHEDDDQDDDTAEQQAAGEDGEEPGDEDEAGQAEAQQTGADDDDDDDARAEAEAEAEAEVEEPSYEPVEDGEADAEAEDAAEEQAEGEEKLVEYEEEEEEGAADDEGEKEHQDDGAGADQYDDEGGNDHDGEEEDGEEQQDEAEEGEGDYPEEPDAEEQDVEEGYDEEEAVEGEDDAQHAESSATAGEEANGNGNGDASEAPARLGKRSFDGEDELNGDDHDAAQGESGVEAKKVKASH